MSARFALGSPFVGCLLLVTIPWTPAQADGAAQDRRIYDSPDTIRVEADRIHVDPLKVPMATTVLSPSDWKSARSAGLDEALREVPGVLAQSRGGGQDVRITNRGFGARGAGERSNAGTTRGIRIMLDGFPLTEPDGRTSLDLADLGLLQRVRVIRSNTSALFGTASGGVIDLYSVTPFATPFAEARAEFGSFGYQRQQFRSGFLSGSARISLSGSTSDFDGWREHSGGSQSTLLASLLADPSPRTSFGIYLAGTRNLQRQAGALTREELQADPRQANPTYLSQNARRDNRILRAGVTLDERFGNGQVVKLKGFLEPKTIHRSERSRYRDFQRINTGGSAVWSAPVGIGPAPTRLTAGLDEAFQDGTTLFYSVGPGGSRGTDLVANKREGINVFGMFTEVNVAPAPRFDATIGARWDFIHYIYEDFIEPNLDDDMTLKRGSPRLAIAYHPSPRHTVYATMNGGIENPAFNEVDPPPEYAGQTGLNPLLKPIFSTTYELGGKGDLRFGRGGLDKLAYDLALYTLEVKNDLIPFDGGAYYYTAGRSTRRGVELGLSAATDYGLSFRFSGTFTRNRYEDYTRLEGEDEVDYGGNHAAGLPSSVLNLTARHELRSGPYAEVTARRVGAYFANDANSDTVDGYALLDATLGASVRFAGVDAALFVSGRNLTGEAHVASVYINGSKDSASGLNRYLEPGLERNYLAGITIGTGGAER